MKELGVFLFRDGWTVKLGFYLCPTCSKKNINWIPLRDELYENKLK